MSDKMLKDVADVYETYLRTNLVPTLTMAAKLLPTEYDIEQVKLAIDGILRDHVKIEKLLESTTKTRPELLNALSQLRVHDKFLGGILSVLSTISHQLTNEHDVNLLKLLIKSMTENRSVVRGLCGRILVRMSE